MTVKVLVTAVGQHIVADVKQVEQKDTKEVIAYWLTKPRVASYNISEDKEVSVRFSQYCLLSDEQEFSIRADNVVSILEPRAEVIAKWEEIVNAGPEETEENATDDATAEVGDDAPVAV